MDEKQIKMMQLFGYAIEELPGKTIPKMTFYKPDGSALAGLPADSYHLRRYLSRGLTLEPPKLNIEALPRDNFVAETGGEKLIKATQRGRPKSQKKEK